MSSPKKITLKSSDGEVFEVDEVVAMESLTIKHMIEDDCANAIIPVPNVTGKILSKVIEYSKKHVESSTTIDVDLKTWDTDFVKDVDQNTLFNLVLSIAEVAEDIWDRYGHDYKGLFNVLSHINYNVRLGAREALAAALDENPDTMQESLSNLFSLYIRDDGFGEDNIDAGWLGRQGITLALHSAADVLKTKDLPLVMTFLISRALESDEEKYDLVREGVVIFTGA